METELWFSNWGLALQRESTHCVGSHLDNINQRQKIFYTFFTAWAMGGPILTQRFLWDAAELAWGALMNATIPLSSCWKKKAKWLCFLGCCVCVLICCCLGTITAKSNYSVLPLTPCILPLSPVFPHPTTTHRAAARRSFIPY